MATQLVLGNIFNTKCHVIVNTVNCVGVMGAGIALECRLRYPQMYEKYIQDCKAGKVEIGKLRLYKVEASRWILNFPTKLHWRYPSKPEYIRKGLDAFRRMYRSFNIESVAFPLLGADKGRLAPQVSLEIMRSYLDDLPLFIEIYRYDRSAGDELYENLKQWILSYDPAEISRRTGIKLNYVKRIVEAVKSPTICQVNQLAKVRGIGIRTLEKLFRLAGKIPTKREERDEGLPVQQTLQFD